MMTPKPTAFRFHSDTDVMMPPMVPMAPSHPTGIRSPLRRNASASRTAHADRTTIRTGTMGMMSFSMMSTGQVQRVGRRGRPDNLFHRLAHRRFHRLQEHVRKDAHDDRHRANRSDDAPFPDAQVAQ